MEVIINCDTAEEIIQAWNSEQHQQHQEGVRMFRAFQDQVSFQCQQNKLFCQTVDALQEQYGRRMYAAKQLLQRFETTLLQLDQEIQHLEAQKENIQQQMQRYEQDLPLIQRYAHERQIKRSKRQRQYDTLYWIPFISSQYKLKYMRARDKFSRAEHQVAQIRQAMDSCHRACRRIATTLCHTRDQHEQSSLHRSQIEKQWQQLDTTLRLLDEGRRFWYDFEKYQAHIVIESVNHLTRALTFSNQQKKEENQDTEQWAKTFKMACFEYDECLKHGQERWYTIQVEFDCSICNNVRWEWPCLDKVHGLLCHTCQQSIIETQQNLECTHNHGNTRIRSSTVSSVTAISHRKKRTSLVSDQASSIRSESRPLVIKRLLKNVFAKCSSPKRPYSPLVH